MDSQFSPRIKDVLTYSREEAIRLGNEQIGLEHIFLGILREGEGIAIDILTNLGVNLSEVKEAIESTLRTDNMIDPQASVQLLKSAEKALKLVYLEARAFNSSTINTGHLLLALLKDKESQIAALLSEFHVNYYILKSRLEDYKQPEAKSDFGDEDDVDDPSQSSSLPEVRLLKKQVLQNQKPLYSITLVSILPRRLRTTISTQL